MSIVAQVLVDKLLGELVVLVKGEIGMLHGVRDEVKKLQRRLEMFRGFLLHAEPIHTDSHVAALVKVIKDVMYDADDMLDTYTMDAAKLLLGDDEQQFPSSAAVRSPFLNKLFSCFRCLKHRHAVGRGIKELNDRIDDILKENHTIATLARAHSGTTGQIVRGGSYRRKAASTRRQTSPIEDVSSVVGTQIENAAHKLISSIEIEDSDEAQCRFFAVTGMGGMGKTTLARRVYTDDKISKMFSKLAHESSSSDSSKLKMWLHVSKFYSEAELLKEIVRNLGGGDDDKGEKSRAELEQKLVSLLPRSLFLVLDDVWSDHVWYKLLKGPLTHKATTKCRILVTTRNESVAKGLRARCIHHVDRMDHDTCWDLLCKEVFDDGEEDEARSLRQIGAKIVEKCDGLPLAIKAIAGVLRCTDKSITEWDRVLRSEIWSMTRINDEVPGALYLSYEDLHPILKQCFVYSSLISATSSSLHTDDLVRYWIDEGFIIANEDRSMEEAAEEYCLELIERNLLQRYSDDYVASKICTMHDLFQSLGLFLMNDDAICVKGEQRVATGPLLKLRRLFISNTGDVLKVPDGVTEPRHLRTLFICECSQTKSLQDDLFRKLCNLRILMLSDSNIEELPDSVGELLHLRHLDVDRTHIAEIPNSIGNLSNLQTLRAGGCERLHYLPSTVTRLHKLRLLHITGTPLSHVPKGIGKLKDLNAIAGLIIGRGVGGSNEKEENGCDLDELQHLSFLSVLSLRSVHRSSGEGAASALAGKRFLRVLELSEPTLNTERSEDQVIRRAERIYDDLTPPSCLRRLKMDNFRGLRFPRWMMSSSLGDSFPDLTALELWSATSCRELPPQLSQLPRLKYLHIRRADAITTIGPQFFACRVRPGAAAPAAAFPKLQEMVFQEMQNWEEWSSSGEVVDLSGSDGSATATVAAKLLPSLRKLSLSDCPKLRALPECLSLATNLRELCIERSGLTKVDHLPSLRKVTVSECDMLEEIINLPAFSLLFHQTPELEHVDEDALPAVLEQLCWRWGLRPS